MVEKVLFSNTNFHNQFFFFSFSSDPMDVLFFIALTSHKGITSILIILICAKQSLISG